MRSRPFWESGDKAQITTPVPLSRTLKPATVVNTTASRAAHNSAITTRGKLAERRSFSDNLSQLYELWEAQRAELQASGEPLPKRIEALGRLARVLPQLAVAERLHKAKRGDKAIEEMSDDELQAMLSKELAE